MSTGSNLYSQGFGTTSSSSFPGNSVVEIRDPSSSDIRSNSGSFSIGQLWVNKSTNQSFQLTSYSPNSSGISATWTSLNGGSGSAIGKIGVEAVMAPGTNPVLPDGSGQVSFSSLQLGNGSAANGIVVGSVAANDVVIAIQLSGANATPDVTKNGISHFDSSSFSVDSDGFVTLVGGGSSGIQQLLPNSGTSPVVPNGSNQVTLVGSGSITTVGSTNTLTAQLTGLTNHNVLVGAGTTTITNVSPSSTSGIPLVSNGSSSDPSFTTVVVAGGGTGSTSLTSFAPICGGTSSTGAVQSADTGIATSGFVLTSNGNAALPTWQSAGGGSGIVTLDGNSGSATGSTVTISTASGTPQFTGSGATLSLDFLGSGNNLSFQPNSYASISGGANNVAIGLNTLNALTSGRENVAIGSSCLNSITSASNNVAIGNMALSANTASNNVAVGNGASSTSSSSSDNVVMGSNAMFSATGSHNVMIGSLCAPTTGAPDDCVAIGYIAFGGSGNRNTCVGASSLLAVDTGIENTAFGYSAGSNYTGADRNNICIGSSVLGVSGNSNEIRIGNVSATTCFITGISGATVTGSSVLCDSNGQLGTISSSMRYKKEIRSLDTPDWFYDIRPVQFRYKDNDNEIQYGMIAEEVVAIAPELALFDKEGRPDGVQYHKLTAVLLNEIQKLKHEVDILKAKIG